MLIAVPSAYAAPQTGGSQSDTPTISSTGQDASQKSSKDGLNKNSSQKDNQPSGSSTKVEEINNKEALQENNATTKNGKSGIENSDTKKDSSLWDNLVNWGSLLSAVLAIVAILFSVKAHSKANAAKKEAIEAKKKAKEIEKSMKQSSTDSQLEELRVDFEQLRNHVRGALIAEQQPNRSMEPITPKTKKITESPLEEQKKAIIAEYNRLFTLEGGSPRRNDARNSFFKKFDIVGMEFTTDGKFNEIGDLSDSAYYAAKLLNNEWAVFPTDKGGYEQNRHKRSGYERCFKSNFVENKHYDNIQVLEPLVLKMDGSIKQQGRLDLS